MKALFGQCWVVFMVNIWKRIANKTRCNYVASLWTSNFLLSLSENPETHQFHDFRTFKRVHDSRTLSSEKPRYLKQSKKNKSRSGNIILGNIKVFGNRKLWKCWNRRAPQHHEDLSWNCLKTLNMRSISINNMKCFWNLECGINIYPKALNESLVIWNQDISNNMKQNVGIMGSIFFRKHEMHFLKLCLNFDQETKKLWNEETKKLRIP